MRESSVAARRAADKGLGTIRDHAGLDLPDVPSRSRLGQQHGVVREAGEACPRSPRYSMKVEQEYRARWRSCGQDQPLAAAESGISRGIGVREIRVHHHRRRRR